MNRPPARQQRRGPEGGRGWRGHTLDPGDEALQEGRCDRQLAGNRIDGLPQNKISEIPTNVAARRRYPAEREAARTSVSTKPLWSLPNG